MPDRAEQLSPRPLRELRGPIRAGVGFSARRSRAFARLQHQRGESDYRALTSTLERIRCLHAFYMMAENKKGNGGRGVSWRERETLDLLSFWGEEEVQEALGISHRNIDIFERIAEQMAAKGHKRTAVECRTKTKALRQEYKKVTAHNQSSYSPVTCPFYNELHRILREDARIRPKRVPRILNLPAEEEERTLSTEGMGGSEMLASHNVLTIKHEDIRCSTPVDAGISEAVPNIAESSPVLEEQLDETKVMCNMQQGDIAASGDQAALPEGHKVQPSTPASEEQGEPSDAEQERPVVVLSPAARLANVRHRKRRFSLLNDVAHQMLRQCETEEANANWRHKELLVQNRRQHEEMMAEERRRRNQLVEEARLDRQVFLDAMQKNTDAMLAAVKVLKTIGEVMLARQGGVPEQGRG
ncbi:myb/SANT-like DNA-binding domain-containing protein 7 [Heteronotia binoei]|uniref:myb/SANT-like DNA-binding domain-containing protein 7 n=1 Tax=Heteronotia binoei TaxID=13085 RepID=UPI0029312AAF|nr:myb/SANT-like DNA-binding domain-containing protein 7 [Heteronotia binoei]